jgi:hypothetical protein
LAKQNTATLLWSRRMEYVSGDTDRTPGSAKYDFTVHVVRTFSAGSGA